MIVKWSAICHFPDTKDGKIHAVGSPAHIRGRFDSCDDGSTIEELVYLPKPPATRGSQLPLRPNSSVAEKGVPPLPL